LPAPRFPHGYSLLYSEFLGCLLPLFSPPGLFLPLFTTSRAASSLFPTSKAVARYCPTSQFSGVSSFCPFRSFLHIFMLQAHHSAPLPVPVPGLPPSPPAGFIIALFRSKNAPYSSSRVTPPYFDFKAVPSSSGHSPLFTIEIGKQWKILT